MRSAVQVISAFVLFLGSASATAAAVQVEPPTQQTPAVQPPQASEAGGTLTFMLGISLQTTINRMNGQCISNLISIPGPPGWPGSGSGLGNSEQARLMIRKYFSEFVAKCGQIAPVGRGEPFYVWNNRGNADRLIEEHARAIRNQMPEVHISP